MLGQQSEKLTGISDWGHNSQIFIFYQNICTAEVNPIVPNETLNLETLADRKHSLFRLLYNMVAVMVGLEFSGLLIRHYPLHSTDNHLSAIVERLGGCLILSMPIR